MSDNKSNAEQNQPDNGISPAPDLTSEVQKLHEQAEKFKNDYLYLRAEFDNYKKHAIKERSDLLKFGGERLAKDLLGVLDNFERALSTKVTAENFPTFVKGIELTAQELKNTLNKNGIQEVSCEGLPFDPAFHEALSSEVSDQVPSGHILRVFQKAYKIHEKSLRTAQVVVARKPE